MAEAFFNEIVRQRALDAQAESAGTEPTELVHPEVVEAMRDVGIDLAGRKPKVLTNEQVVQADRVITMGCAVDAGTCPAVFVKNVEDWGLEDPKGKPLEKVREIRDEIRQRVLQLLSELGVAAKS